MIQRQPGDAAVFVLQNGLVGHDTLRYIRRRPHGRWAGYKTDCGMDGDTLSSRRRQGVSSWVGGN